MEASTGSRLLGEVEEMSLEEVSWQFGPKLFALSDHYHATSPHHYQSLWRISRRNTAQLFQFSKKCTFFILILSQYPKEFLARHSPNIYEAIVKQASAFISSYWIILPKCVRVFYSTA
jgi:hypothetical protein